MQGIANIKPDIKFMTSGKISIMRRAYNALGIKPGDAINLTEIKGEIYMYVAQPNAGTHFKGRTYQSSHNCMHLYVQWKEMAQYIINKDGRAPEAHYRAGEPVKINGTKYLPIITRRNYAAKNQL